MFGIMVAGGLGPNIAPLFGAIALGLLGVVLLVVLLHREARARLRVQNLETRLAASQEERNHQAAGCRDLEDLMQRSSSLVCFASTDGAVLRVNPAFEAFLGCKRDHPTRRFTDFVHSADIRSTQAAFGVVENGGSVEDLTIRCLHRDGRYRWLSWRAIRTRSGRLAATARDITSSRSEKDLLRSAVEALPNAILVVGPTGHIRSANHHAEQLFGYTQGELVGRVAERLVPHALEHRRSDEVAPAGGNDAPSDPAAPAGRNRDLWGIRQDGTRVAIEIGLGPVQCEDGPHVVITVTDVSERRRYEAERQSHSAQLEEISSRLSLALDAAEMGLFSQDLATGEAQFDARARQVLGSLGSEDLDRVVARIHPEDRQLFVDRVRSVASGAVDYAEWGYRLESGRGAYRWVHSRATGLRDASGRVVRLSGVVWDSTDVLEAVAQRERLLQIVEASPDFIGIASIDGRMVYQNRSFVAFSGTGDRRVPQRLHDFYPAEMAERLETEVLPEVLGTGSWQGESVVQSHDGEELPVSQLILLHRDEAGRPSHFSTVMRDLRDLKRREGELEDSNRELERFAYVAAHDLQEPLRMISSFTQLLSNSLGTRISGEEATHLRFVADGAERMRTMVNGLLDYARVNQKDSSFVPVPLASVVEGVRKDLRVRLEETKASLIVADLPVVLGNETLLSQLVQNLVTNALKFTGDSAPEVHIDARMTDRGMVQVGVHDNGIGIDPRHNRKVFDIFRRLHPHGTFEGTGVGLAVAKSIVQRHGGRIWVESRRGTGASFYFTLSKPSCPPPTRSVSAGAAPAVESEL